MADFQLPAVTPFCTNQPYVFNNTTAFDAGSHITWTWLLNNTPVSSSEHLTYTFTQTTAHDIGLIAAIPGCQSQVVKNIAAVAEGPVVDFSTAGHCQMEPVNFTNHTTGTVTSYLWQFDDGNTSTAENPVHSYTMPGVYQVQLSATNAAGCVNTAVRPVTVYARPQTDFSVALPPFSCSGGPTQFTDLTPNPTDSNLATWLWDFNDGGATSTVRHAQHTYATAGQYAVSLTVTTNFGCSATAQKDVQIYPSPSPTFTFSPPCRAVPVQFTDGTTSPLQQWFWQIETSTYTTQNPVHTFSTSGPKNVTLTVTAANGCVGSTTQTLQVPAILVPDFMAERTCTHQQTLFTSLTNDAADPIASFNWNFGSAGTASGNPAVATFTATGNPAITLTVTTQTGCAYARTKNINISAAPAAAFSVSADVGGAPLTVQFTNTSAGATAYLWEFGEGSASTEVSPQFTYQAVGTYVASLTAFNAIQCQSKAVRTIHVVNPVLDVQVPLLELMQSGTGFTPAVTIQNRSNVPLINPVVAYDLAGAATVQEIVPATIAPNASYRHVSALVYPGVASAYLCATLLVDDGTPADNRYCATAEQTTAVIAPFPNPVSRQQQQLTVEWSASRPGVAFIEMRTLTGQQVFAQSVQVAQGYNAVQINPWYLNEGMYLLRLQADEQWFAFRIQVIR
jgi:PKD repeat protein